MVLCSARVKAVFRDSALSLVNRRDLFGPSCPSIFQYLCHALRASTAYTLPFIFWAFAGAQKRNSTGAGGKRLSKILGRK